jgi:hypothetical protein
MASSAGSRLEILPKRRLAHELSSESCLFHAREQAFLAMQRQDRSKPNRDNSNGQVTPSLIKAEATVNPHEGIN